MQKRRPGDREVQQWTGSFQSGITRTGNWKGKWRRGESSCGAKWFAEACALYSGHCCFSSTATASSCLSREIEKTNSNLSIYLYGFPFPLNVPSKLWTIPSKFCVPDLATCQLHGGCCPPHFGLTVFWKFHIIIFTMLNLKFKSLVVQPLSS